LILLDSEPPTRPSRMSEKPSNNDAGTLPSDLLVRARANDEAALEELIRARQNRVASFVIGLLGRDGDWQDVCQQIFIKMVLGLRKLDRLDAFEPWLMRIARNACYDHLRRQRTRRFLRPWQDWHEAVPSEPPSSTDEIESAALGSAIERLPAEQRDLMTMMRSRHWSYESLAQTTGLSIAALKSRLFRARRRLRELMTEGESSHES